MEPTHTLCLLNTQISSHGHFVRQLPAVGSCAFAGPRPRAHVCPVANSVLYRDKIILTSSRELRQMQRCLFFLFEVDDQVVSCLYGKYGATRRRQLAANLASRQETGGQLAANLARTELACPRARRPSLPNSRLTQSGYFWRTAACFLFSGELCCPSLSRVADVRQLPRRGEALLMPNYQAPNPAGQGVRCRRTSQRFP